MAIARFSLISLGDTNAQMNPTTVTGSITPTADRLVLAVVVNSKSVNPPATPTCSGCSLTWVQVDEVGYNTAATPLQFVTVFRAMGASPTTGAVTFTGDGTNQTGTSYSIMEFSGIDTSGTNGSGAIVQHVTNAADNAAGLTVTLAAFGSANNATFGAFGCNDSNVPVVGSGFTLIDSVGYVTPNSQLLTEWKTANDTSVDATQGAAASPFWGGIAIEIKAAVASFEHSAGVDLGVSFPTTGAISAGASYL